MAVHSDHRGADIRSISLCAGAGGLDLALQLALPRSRTIAYVEREAYAAATLVARMAAGELDQALVWSDLGTFDGRPFRGRVHLVTSGDPCQPNSVAGKGLGADDDRFLIDQVVRVFDESGADTLFRENVTGNAAGQLAAIVPALERLGCRVAVGIFSVRSVGGAHGRERLFILADRSDGAGWLYQGQGRSGEGTAEFGGRGEQLGDAEDDIGGGEQQSRGARRWRPRSSGTGEGMVDTDGARRPPAGAGPVFDTGRQSEPGGGVMVDPEVFGWREGRPEHELRRGRYAVAGTSGALADADDGGRSGGEPRLGSCGGPTRGERRAQANEPPGLCAALLPVLCPGPSDARWPDILARAPHLEPAVRRMADGLAHRVDRLRLCGNGVHPLAAGYAFVALRALLAADRGAGAIAVRAA